jgi:hypothetical protein
VFRQCLLLGLSMGASTLFAQSAARLDLGRLQTGAAVSFTCSTSGFREPPLRNNGTGGVRPRAVQEAIHQASSGCEHAGCKSVVMGECNL